MYTNVRTDSDNVDFKSLIKLLDQHLNEYFGEQQTFFDQFNKTDAIKNVIVLYNGDEAIACGAFKPYDADTVEIKRMFVKPDYRGKKLGLQVLQQLETWAAELGYTKTVLETGKNLTQAVKLYQGNGYQIIDNYGPYVGVEISVCMMKKVG